jgi:hypothetical protein
MRQSLNFSPYFTGKRAYGIMSVAPPPPPSSKITLGPIDNLYKTW